MRDRRSLTPGAPGGPKVVWRKQVGQGFAGPAVVGNRVILFHRVGSEEVLESLDAATGTSTWRYAYPTTLSRRLRLRRGPARRAGRRRRHHLHVRRRGSAARRRPRQGHARLERGHDEALRRAERILRRRRITTRRGWPRHRQHRRRQGGHRRVRGEDRQGAVDGDRRRRELLVWRGGNDRRQAVGRVSHARQPDRPRSGIGRGAVPAALAGAPRRHPSTPRRRLSSATRSSSRPSTGPAPACYGRWLASWWTSGRRTRCCRITTRRASITTGICTVFTAGRSSARASAPWSSRPGRSSGARISSAPAACSLAGDKLLVIREGGELILAPASPQAFRPDRARADSAGRRAAAIRRIADGLRLCPQREHARLPRSSHAEKRSSPPSRSLVSPAAMCLRLQQRAGDNPRAVLDRAIDDFLAGRVKRIGDRIRSRRGARARRPRRSSGSAASLSTTSAATTTAARSSNRIARSIPTTSRIRPGTFSVSRTRSRRRRRARRCCRSARISARRCAKSTRCSAAR